MHTSLNSCHPNHVSLSLAKAAQSQLLGAQEAPSQRWEGGQLAGWRGTGGKNGQGNDEEATEGQNSPLKPLRVYKEKYEHVNSTHTLTFTLCPH